MDKVRLTTDGSCIGNPGPGGWACLLRCAGHERVLSGAEKATTNNRMELVAVIQGLRALNRPCEVEIVTDSQYVQRGMSEWLERWRATDWKTAKGDPVANRELWEELVSLAQDHKTRWRWVRGHGRDADQQRCDALAAEAARQAERDG
ncbi:MAG: ribonuclease HI [Bryobacterales bacterium]|nr:ribonuclease HI [Bryobacterales bacterium]